jgi:hypothetical protein
MKTTGTLGGYGPGGDYGSANHPPGYRGSSSSDHASKGTSALNAEVRHAELVDEA